MHSIGMRFGYAATAYTRLRSEEAKHRLTTPGIELNQIEVAPDRIIDAVTAKADPKIDSDQIEALILMALKNAKQSFYWSPKPLSSVEKAQTSGRYPEPRRPQAAPQKIQVTAEGRILLNNLYPYL